MQRIAFALTLLAATASVAKAPRLTLFIAVDSLSSEQFLKARPRLKGGFQQLLSQGAFFPTTRYPYAENRTANGHATLSTGATPARHGAVGNTLFNRQTLKFEPVFSDPSHPVLEAPLAVEDVSPQNLLAETLADRLRMFTHERGKAIAIAAKARGAIPFAGRLGQAWWFSESVGKFVTGTYYAKEFPEWVKAFNERKLPETYFAKEWTLSLKPADYLGEDNRPFEADVYALGRTFPHPLNGRLPSPGPQSNAAMSHSPHMDELTVEFAKAAIDSEQLGKDDQPDLLMISFGALDRVYHMYGPNSWEAQDALVKLDKYLGDLLSAAQKAAGGRENLLVVISADHGGAAIPEEYSALGLTSARLSPDALRAEINKALSPRFGGAEVVAGIEEVDFYLNAKALAEKKVDPVGVRRAVAEWLNAHPQMAWAIARDDLQWASHPMAKAVRAGFHPERSGDVLAVVKPYIVVSNIADGTSHGTPYSYDSQVPLIIAGRGVRGGTYRQEISPVDVAPTIAALLEIGVPATAEGSPRAEILDTK